MSKTAPKKGPNKKRIPTPSSTNQIRARRVAAVTAAAAAKKRPTPASGNAGNSKMRKKKLSHQQASQARDMLDAEFRDLRSGNLQREPPSGAATTTMAVPRPSDRISEQSVQDLAGILGAL